jgi:hypothetical protein
MRALSNDDDDEVKLLDYFLILPSYFLRICTLLSRYLRICRTLLFVILYYMSEGSTSVSGVNMKGTLK